MVSASNVYANHTLASDDHLSLSNLLDSIPSLVARVDCNMLVKFSNKSFRKCFSADDGAFAFPLIVGQHVFSQIQRHLGSVLVGKTVHFQISLGSSKSFRYMDVDLSPQFDDRHRVNGFIFHGTDITEKHNTARELKDYFENASIGLHWVDANGIIIWANPAELKLLGYAPEEYIGHHISKFHAHPDVISDILLRLDRRETLHNYHAEMLCKDGSTRHVAINSSVLWEDDKFIHTRCFTIDITEQKLAERAIRESEERFKMMANVVPLVIWTTNEQGDCNFLSVRWKELTGKTQEEGFCDRWLNWVHAEDRQKIRESWQRSLSARKPFEAKFRYVNPKGGYAITYANATPRHNASGDFIGYIGILQDVSTQAQITSSLEKIVMARTEDLRRRNAELKSAENSLKEKNKTLERMNQELSSFAYVASHDLQEPLRKIQTFSDRVLTIEHSKLSEKGKDYFNRIQNAAYRMRTLIEDLLAYSRASIADGKYEITDLNQLLLEVMNELEVEIEEKKATIEFSELPALHVVKFQIHQLFLNLLSNALKFSKTSIHPHIVIISEQVNGDQVPGSSADTKKSYYHISVSDNGIGFEEEYSSKIFEIFHRLHGREEYEGTGIGLAICKKIIENHEGVITAEGKKDYGSTFHIYLPA